MKNKILILLCCILLSNCDKWLDIKPYDQISEEELLKTEEGFQKLLNGIYIELNREELYGQSLSVEMVEIMGGVYEIGDDSNVWGNYSDLKRYDFGTEYWRNRFTATWNKAYALILNCNKILENIEGKEDMFTQGGYDIIRGEALALRAMLHFDILRLFGPVYSKTPEAKSIPYYTHRTNTPEPQLPASEVLNLIVTDLKEALIALKDDPIITEGTMMSSLDNGQSNFYRYRALRLNYYAVEGLLARVELYAGNRAEAYKHAFDVIAAADRGIFPFVDSRLVIGSVTDPDRIFSSEVIFALTNTQRVKIFNNFFDPKRTTFTFKMESNLLNDKIFGGGSVTGGYQDDFRNRAIWNASGSNRFFFKYADMAEPGRIENTMIPMLRLGEMYLIAAECKGDNLNAGLSLINLLRSKRGIKADYNHFDETLLKYEYIRELYGEGQLFFLYKRLYSDIIRSASDKDNPKASQNIFVVPLPEGEIEVEK